MEISWQFWDTDKFMLILLFINMQLSKHETPLCMIRTWLSDSTGWFSGLQQACYSLLLMDIS
jgi:hypothetical protein